MEKELFIIKKEHTILCKINRHVNPKGEEYFTTDKKELSTLFVKQKELEKEIKALEGKMTISLILEDARKELLETKDLLDKVEISSDDINNSFIKLHRVSRVTEFFLSDVLLKELFDEKQIQENN